MWRSLFLAVGTMMIIIGIEAMLIDSATVYAAADSSAAEFMDPSAPAAVNTKIIQPGEWTPWVILSVGSVVVLYAFTLPQRWHRPAAA
ncbi:MAG: hypothetical protein ACO1RT_18925 [Planctomycetaceae bacterium]